MLTRPAARIRRQTPSSGATAQRYAQILGWRLIPGHWLDDEGRCTCARADCTAPGAHPLVEPWQPRATADPRTLHDWWETYPQASVLVAPDAFVGISVPARWGMAAVGLPPTEGGWRQGPVTNGRGWFTFFVLDPGRDHETRTFAPLVRAGRCYGQAVFALMGAEQCIPLPPTCHGTPLAYTWSTPPFTPDHPGLPHTCHLPTAPTAVRGLIEAAVRGHEADASHGTRAEMVRRLLGA